MEFGKHLALQIKHLMAFPPAPGNIQMTHLGWECHIRSLNPLPNSDLAYWQELIQNSLERILPEFISSNTKMMQPKMIPMISRFKENWEEYRLSPVILIRDFCQRLLALYPIEPEPALSTHPPVSRFDFLTQTLMIELMARLTLPQIPQLEVVSVDDQLIAPDSSPETQVRKIRIEVFLVE